jgi:ubiquinone/menaquinone biosynthesis C-methylase UbiE
MLERVLEPEVMDSADDAREYDAMDHAHVNSLFVTELLDALGDWSIQQQVSLGSAILSILDLGAGTAQIPIALARRAPWARITALDAAQSMLVIAAQNIAAADLTHRVGPTLGDAKQTTFQSDSFPVVVSNSILHHIPNPRAVIAEAIRVTAPGGLLFHRDLCRPNDETDLNHIVNTYAAGATPHQRKLFAESLRAALTVDEMRQLVAEFGYPADTCRATSDRHWTWIAIKSS